MSSPKRIVYTSALVPFTLLSGGLTGCVSHPPLLQKKGMIAKIGEGVMKIDEVDADRICGDHYCEPNYIYEASFGRKKPKPPTPPAPQYPRETLDWSRRTLEVEEAWKVTKGSANVVVAVVDTGVANRHPDLARSMWVNPVEANGRAGNDDDGNGLIDDIYGYDFANNRANGVDDHGHGSHCAGVIAAAENGIGIVGVAPQVKIMALKFLDAQGYGDTANAIAAIRYATMMGAQIISNSWGGGGASQLLDNEIQFARSRGVLVVAAAGNNSNNNDRAPSYPANYAGVVSVAASDETDNLAYFSNYGAATVTLAAPGTNIYSTVINDQWGNMSGTSMATPQVSGALALGLSVNPNVDRAEIVQDLCDTSVRFSGPTRCGRMNVRAFVNRVVGNY